MKKKLLAAALAVALIAIMVTGTLAYFTAGDEATNTFTVGSVDIEIYENGNATDKDVIAFDEMLVPVVADDPTQDDGYIPKAVKVESTGRNAAYIRAHIAIPTALVGYLMLDVDTQSGWTQVATTTATKDGVAYTVYTYDYDAAVEPAQFTTELLKGVYLASDVDVKDNPDTQSADLEFCKPNGDGTYTFTGFVAHEKTDAGYSTATVNVLVASQAIQSQGFDNGATDALDTGFVANTNPWQ